MTHTQKPTIRISFIRYGCVNKQPRDDYVIISHKGEDRFHVYYHDANNIAAKHHFTVLTAEGLDTYLFSLFTLISRDADPFSDVQIDIPCMPSVIYKPEQLNGRRLMEALSYIMPILTVSAIVYVDPKNV